jgi:hypothetical protein
LNRFVLTKVVRIGFVLTKVVRIGFILTAGALKMLPRVLKYST